MSKVYVFDLDGTLADVTHRLHHIEKKPKDWDGFFAAADQDPPIAWICKFLKNLSMIAYEDGDRIIILSGRADKVREQTVQWLTKHGMHRPYEYHELIMRKGGDYRPDEIIKPEMLMEYLDAHPGCEVEFIVDDRQRVVDMWRSKGYNVLQCNAWKETVA